MEYLRRVGDNYKELSYEMPANVIEDCKNALEWADYTGRNKLGAVLAVLRALKENDRLIVN